MRRRTTVVVLLAFAVGFVALEVNGYTRQSATWDEPIHLTAGYAALAQQDFRVDPSHPPFLRIWAALPLLLFDRLTLDTATIDRTPIPEWFEKAYAFAHQFMYVDNDADRLLYAARFMVVLLGVALGVLLFCWVKEWLGFLPAVSVLAFYTLEPNLTAHASLVTTDFGVTLFTFGAVYFLWRCCHHRTALNLMGLTTCFALAIVTKFSAILLAPIVALLLGTAVVRRDMTARAACGIAGVLAVATFVAVWTVYGFRYAPSASPGWSLQLHETPMAQSAPVLAGVVRWSDSYHVLPNAFTQGFLYNQTSVQELGAFLAGRYSTDGWWYYFPFAFLIKTPLALLALICVGVFAYAKRGHDLGLSNQAFVVVPIAVYLGVAMTSGINIGLRHILPIYPFVLLIAAAAVKELAARNRVGRLVAGTLAVVWVAEFATAYPYTLTFFNQLVGGPQNGFRYLADSNLGWGQTLKPLKQWMDRNGVSHVNLAYFGQADPAYYRINCTHLPGAPSFAIESVARPRLPGFVAIGSTVLSGVYLPPHLRLFYKPFQDLAPVAVIGNSMRVYWVDRWPETTGRYADITDIDAHRTLADALLFGQQWPTRALRHYREYLKHRPDDTDVLVNAAIALAAAGESEEAILTLRRAVDTKPDDGRARLMLARALFGDGDLDGSALHAEQAVTLASDSADAHDLLGRVRAVQGRMGEAEAEFERALRIDPTHAEARDHLSRIQGRTRQ